MVSDQDRVFLDSISPVFAGKKYLIPEPTNCPDCRHQRRQAWRNESKLYKRNCDLSGKPIISVFSPDKPFKVYNNPEWFSDTWNALEYGRDFDFNRPFAPQFRELMEAVPQLARSAINNENCDFTNQIGWCKNCYFVFEADYNQDCFYSNYLYESRSSMELYQCQTCELCYECIDCRKCYNLRYSQDCDNCSDAWFLFSCIGCRNCFGCVNLRNKEYYFYNEALSKEEYQSRITGLDLHHRENIMKAQTQALEFSKSFPKKYLHGTQNEDSTGDYLWNTQRCRGCYDLQDSQDCQHVTNSRHMKNVHDTTVFGAKEGAEFCYENHEIGESVRNVCFSDQVWLGCNDIFYSKLCIESSNNLFACVGLRHASYCVFNKQYSKDEYEKLVSKIIEHMIKTRSTGSGQAGEWGEYLPASISPMGYNETVANLYFPLSREQAFEQGFRWTDYEAPKPQAEKIIPGARLPDEISQVPDDVLNWAIQCEKTGRLFKIQQQELAWYRNQNMPMPTMHPEERVARRMSLRNSRKLFTRNCQKCQKELETTYAPERPEQIYCERCYLESTS